MMQLSRIRQNRFTQSEVFSSANWSKSACGIRIGDTIQAPDGRLISEIFRDDIDVNGQHLISQHVDITSGDTVTHILRVKPLPTGTGAAMFNQWGHSYIHFDLNDARVTSAESTSQYQASARRLGDWVEMRIKWTSINSNGQFYFGSSTGSSHLYDGSSADQFYLMNAQFTNGHDFDAPYIKTEATAIDSGAPEFVELEPEWNYERSVMRNQSQMRARSGANYSYKWGSHEKHKFAVSFVNSATKSIVNSW